MNDKRVAIRIPTYLDTMLAGAAERHGRNPSAEARVALELHAHRALLLDVRDRSPAIMEMLEGDEDAFTKFAEQVEADTAALEVLAYRKQPIVDLRRTAAASN